MRIFFKFSVDAAFHPKCGRNVRLKDNGCVASRVNSYKDGVTFSACPLREGEVFKVRREGGKPELFLSLEHICLSVRLSW